MASTPTYRILIVVFAASFTAMTVLPSINHSCGQEDSHEMHGEPVECCCVEMVPVAALTHCSSEIAEIYLGPHFSSGDCCSNDVVVADADLLRKKSQENIGARMFVSGYNQPDRVGPDTAFRQRIDLSTANPKSPPLSYSPLRL